MAVYKLPLTCGNSYIGQTGKCINERLTEHLRANISKVDEYKTLSTHMEKCKCKPNPKSTITLGSTGRDRKGREIWEAFCIRHQQTSTISEPSIGLSDAEYKILLDWHMEKENKFNK